MAPLLIVTLLLENTTSNQLSLFVVHLELAGQSYPIVNPLSVKILLYQKILQLVLLKFPLKQLLWTHIHHLRSQK